MVLNYEYGINTGNRFLDLVDHDEDPDDFIAQQTQPEEKPKKSKTETKSAATKPTKKTATTTTTATATTSTVSAATTKTNKENLPGKPTNTDQRKQQTNVLSNNNNNQQPRGDSARGGRGSARRGGGSAGQERPPYEGGNRGGGQQRTQRFNKFEGQQTSNEPSGFEQSGDAWGNEPANDNQQGGSFRGRGGRGRGRGNYEGGRGNYEGGRGRGNYEGGRGRGNYEGGRGRGNYEGGRGRGNYEGGRGRGRGNYNNRSFEEGSQQQQQQQQTQEGSGWEQSAESNFDSTRPQSGRTGGQELDADVPVQERPFEPGNQRGGRGHFRSRTFHNNRNYGSDRSNQPEREGDQEDFRHNRRQHDRQPRSNLSGVKPIEKKDGEGAHNWGSPTENPEDNPVPDDTNDTTGQTSSAPKDWAQQVDEEEKQRSLDESKKQITLDEYKKQLEAKKRAQQEKVPQFNRRTAGEGEDPKTWQTFEQEYRKKNEGEEDEGEEVEEGSGSEADESGEENEEEQATGKKKLITIPLRFKPIDIPRGGPAGSRGGPRRGGAGGNGGRYRDRPTRDDQPRSKSPSQQQSSYYQQTGEYQNDDQPQSQQQQQQQQSRPYRGGGGGGSGRGFGRGEYRRPYGNSARGPRGSYNRSNTNPNTPDFDNTLDFPTLAKQQN